MRQVFICASWARWVVMMLWARAHSSGRDESAIIARGGGDRALVVDAHLVDELRVERLVDAEPAHPQSGAADRAAAHHRIAHHGCRTARNGGAAAEWVTWVAA